MWVPKSQTQNLTISFMFKKKDELNNSKLKEKRKREFYPIQENS